MKKNKDNSDSKKDKHVYQHILKNDTGLDWTREDKKIKGVIVFSNGNWEKVSGARVVIVNPDSIKGNVIIDNLEYSDELNNLLLRGDAQEISISDLVEFYLKNETYSSIES